jgi:hypothetical protein
VKKPAGIRAAAVMIEMVPWPALAKMTPATAHTPKRKAQRAVS